jgi:polyisoprenoid-binding protein YceI
MKLISTFVIGSFITLSSLVADNYSVDTTHSSIEFKIRHMMVSKTKGEFTTYSGNYNYDAKKHHLLALNGSVDIASVDTRSAKRDADLKTAEYFDLKKHPKMHLSLVNHKGDKAIVNLTIKGITKKVAFHIDELSDEIKDPWGNTRTGLSLSTTINRKDFNVGANTGAMMVGEDVKITLEIEGIKEK